MKDAVAKAMPTVRKVAPHVIGAMMEPALRLALDSLHKYNQQSSGGAEGFEVTEPFQAPVYSAAFGHAQTATTEAFIQSLHGAMHQSSQEALDAESQNSFLDSVEAAAFSADKGLLAVANTGLLTLANGLPAEGAESSEEGADLTTSQALSADALATRAVVAEAALQAVMKLPAHQLQEEGLLGNIGGFFQKIAPTVMKVAPTIVSAINPTASNIVGGIAGALGGLFGTSSATESGSFRRRQPVKGLRPRRSLATLRNPGAPLDPPFNASGFQQSGFKNYSNPLRNT